MDKSILLNNEVMTRKDGFYQLDKDLQAVKEFLKDVNKKSKKFESTEEKVKWMVDNDYYYDVYAEYTEDQVMEIYNIAYSYEFKFQSYMAVSKFYKDYAVKTNDKKKYLETYEDRCAIVALYLGRGSIKSARSYVRSFVEQRYQPATPTFLNAGKSRRGEMVSCFLLEVQDSLNSINFNIGTSMQLSKIGGGVALNLSKLRARGESIKGVEGAAKGVLPVMKLLEDSFSYADQMGQRKGAGAVYLNVFHLDVLEFLDTKKINADEKSRIQSLSIGLIMHKKFFEIAKAGKDFFMFAPHTVYKEYGIELDDMDMNVWYDKLAKNKNVKKKSMSAREMLNKIAHTQTQSGYPYIMFKDNANDQHALKDLGDVKISNLCTEIFQLQTPTEIADYGSEDQIGYDINCNLGSLNTVNVMESKMIKESVHTGIEALTAVSDMTSIENAPTVKKANDDFHAVGLGMMNLHGYLTKNKIAYESPEAREFAGIFAMMINFHSIEKSMMISKERGVTFKGFEKSEYAKGTYFELYKTDFRPKSDKVKALFEGIHVPSPEDWAELAKQVKEYGMYHGYRLAIAPTQSIGYIQNATASVMPIVDQVEIRTYSTSTTYFPMPYLARDNMFFYKSAYNMNQFKLIDMIAEMQPHIDQGISTILFVDSSTNVADLSRYYVYAELKGLKSLYYTRTKNLSVEECTSCSV